MDYSISHLKKSCSMCPIHLLASHLSIVYHLLKIVSRYDLSLQEVSLYLYSPAKLILKTLVFIVDSASQEVVTGTSIRVLPLDH